jgi:hypothetical protein
MIKADFDVLKESDYIIAVIALLIYSTIMTFVVVAQVSARAAEQEAFLTIIKSQGERK